MTLHWVLVLLADGILCVYAMVRWSKLRRENPELRLNFRLIELWAMTFALSPALALFGLAERLDSSGGESAYLVLVLLIPHQLLVAFLMVLRNHTDPIAMSETKDLSTFQEFVFMLNSTLVGLLIPIVTVCAAVVMLLALSIAVIFSPILVPVLIFYAVFRASKKRTVFVRPRATPVRRPGSLVSSESAPGAKAEGGPPP